MLPLVLRTLQAGPQLLLKLSYSQVFLAPPRDQLGISNLVLDTYAPYNVNIIKDIGDWAHMCMGGSTAPRKPSMWLPLVRQCTILTPF